MTSSSEERDLVEGYNLGVNSYIQKPVDFEQFRKTVKTLGLYRLVVNQSPIGLSRSTKTGSVPLSISAEQVDGVVDLGRAIVLVNIQAKRLF
jgi:DNA-binding response OmpR family regulator